MGEPAAARGIVSLGAVQAMRVLLGVLTSVVAARWLGPEGYGLVGFARSVSVTWWFVVGLGAADLVTRSLSADRESGLVQFASARKAIGWSSVVALALMAVTSLALDPRAEVLGLVMLAGLAAVATGRWSLDEAALLGVGRATSQLLVALIARVVQALALVALVVGGWGAAGVLVSSILGDGIHAWGGARATQRVFGPLPETTRTQTASLAKEASPYALNILAGSIYLQSDVLVLQAFRGEGEVGLYQSAAILVLQLPIVAGVVNRGLSPALTRLGGDRAAASEALALPVRALLAISVPVAVGAVVLADDFVALIFGHAYAAAGLALAVMAPLLPLRFLDNTAAVALTALGHQKLRTRAVVEAAVFNLLANLAVVPFYGAAGAAFTTLITECYLLWAFGRTLSKTGVHMTWGSQLARTLAACVPMVGVLWLLHDYSFWIRVGSGAGCWLGVGLWLRAWALSDFKQLMRA